MAVVTGAMAVGVCAVAVAQMPTVPPNWRFTLPGGDAAAGEQAFVTMECFSCHTVQGKRLGDPARNPGRIGPDLTPAHARLPREYLAESVANPRRVVAHGTFKRAYRAPDGSSRMGDYSEIMSVRELIDLIEFLKQIR